MTKTNAVLKLVAQKMFLLNVHKVIALLQSNNVKLWFHAPLILLINVLMETADLANQIVLHLLLALPTDPLNVKTKVAKNLKNIVVK